MSSPGGGDEANDLIAELAKSLGEDEQITDLRDLFKAASHAEECRESIWAQSADNAVETTVPEPRQLPKPMVQRRKQVSLGTAPDDLEILPKSPAPKLPMRELVPTGEVHQLSLFEA